jgi:carbonic anhydrase/acetyltransferase-like protein (isoleucine patch superfamily)
MLINSPFLLSYAGIAPAFAASPIHAGAGSVVLGRATLGRNAWLGAGSVIRADGHFVKVGDDFHLGASSTLHINHEIFPCAVGDQVAVGSNACVHACTVGSDVVIGDGVVILDGAVVEDNVVLEPGSTVFPNKRVPAGALYAGSPAKPVRPLAPGEVAERRAKITRERAEGENTTRRHNATAAGSDVHPSVFIASTAAVRGKLIAAESSSVWYSNSFDAGSAAIRIGARTNIQDNTVIRCATAQGVSIGRESAVGHNVTIHDCVIGDRTLIGIGSTVADGTVVGDCVLLAAAAHTTPARCSKAAGCMPAARPANSPRSTTPSRR